MYDVLRLLIPIGHFFLDLFAEKNKPFKSAGVGSPYRQKSTSSFKIHFSWLFVCGWLVFKLISLAIDTVRLEKKYETAVATCTKTEHVESKPPTPPSSKTVKQQQKISTKQP